MLSSVAVNKKTLSCIIQRKTSILGYILSLWTTETIHREADTKTIAPSLYSIQYIHCARRAGSARVIKHTLGLGYQICIMFTVVGEALEVAIRRNWGLGRNSSTDSLSLWKEKRCLNDLTLQMPITYWCCKNSVLLTVQLSHHCHVQYRYV